MAIRPRFSRAVPISDDVYRKNITVLPGRPFVPFLAWCPDLPISANQWPKISSIFYPYMPTIRPYSGTAVYPHMPILRVVSALNKSACPAGQRAWPVIGFFPFYLYVSARAGRFAGRFWASDGAKFPKMGDSLPWTPINRRAKFYAASFIRCGEIRNRTNAHKITKKQ